MNSRNVAGPLVVVALLALAATPGQSQEWEMVSKSRQTRDQDFLDVRVTYAVGRFELSRGPDRLLYRLNSKFDREAFDLRTNYLESGGRGSLRIEIDGDGGDIEFGLLKDYDYEEGHLRLDLTGDVPLELSVEMGAAEADLDLGGLRLRRLTYETGASESRIRFSELNRETAEACVFKAGAAALHVEGLGNSNCRHIDVSGGLGDLNLDFTGDWQQDATASVSVGLGGIEIRVPSEVGVRVEKSTFLMSFDAPGFEKHRGGTWLSRNWDTADHRLNLKVSGALGGVTIARL